MFNFRKQVACLAVAVVASMAVMPLASVGAQATDMASSIRVSVVAGAMQDTMTKLVKKYQDANPGVTVTLELEPDGGTFQALIAAGNQPDLIITSFGPGLGTLAAQDAAANLDDMPDSAALLERLNPIAVQKLSGHHFYVPIGADVTLMIYNKALFTEAGLDPDKPPATWDEFLAAAKAIDALPARANGDDVYGTVFWNEALQWGGWYWNTLQPIYLNSNGGKCQLLNALGTDIVFDRDECKMDAFFNFVKQAQQYAPPTMEKTFFGRNIGMWMQYGCSWEPNLKSALDKPMVIGDDVAIAPVPVPAAGDPSFTTLGGRGLMILKTAPDREARAWNFIQFLMQDENNLQFISELGYLPFVTTLETDAYFQEPGRQPFIELMKNGRVPEQFAAAEKVAAAIQGVYQKVVVEGSVSLEEAVTQAATDARAALKAP